MNVLKKSILCGSMLSALMLSSAAFAATVYKKEVVVSDQYGSGDAVVVIESSSQEALDLYTSDSLYFKRNTEFVTAVELASGASSLYATENAKLQLLSTEIGELYYNGVPVEAVANDVSASSSCTNNVAPIATASAQSTFPGYSASKINDGDTNTTVGGPYSWSNAHTYGSDGRLPNWVQLDFGKNIPFSNTVLYSSSGYVIRDYDIEIWTGSAWQTAVSYVGNTSVTSVNSFSPIVGSKIRVVGRRGPNNQDIYVRVNELQVCIENMALAATATAQSTFPGYSPSNVNDGDTNTTVGGAYSWSNAHTYGADGRLPNWVQLDFGETKPISKVVIYTSKNFEIKEYDIEVWNGSSWEVVLTQFGNTDVRTEHTFSTRYGSKLRVVGRRGPDNQNIYVRVNELEVY